jgi:hypothetical protein
MTGKTPEPSQESSSAAQPTSGPTAAQPVTSPPSSPAASSPAGSSPAASSAPASAPAVPPQATPAVTTTPAPKAPAAPATTAPATAAPAKSAPPAKSASPAKPPARPAQPRIRSSTGTTASTAMAVAFVAILVAIGATAVALYALDVAREAKSAAAERGAAPAPLSSNPVAAPSRSVAPTATASPTPSVTFAPDTIGALVRVPGPEGCASVFVNVDNLEVGVLAGHEFYVTSCQGPETIRVDRVAAAAPTAQNVTPEACAAQLAGTSTTELVLAVERNLTFCLVTNKQDADQQGIAQRLAIVEIRSTGADRSLQISVSTYRVPAGP